MSDTWTLIDALNNRSKQWFEYYVRSVQSSMDDQPIDFGLGNWFIDSLPAQKIFTSPDWLKTVESIYKQKLPFIKQFFSLVEFTPNHRWDSKLLKDGDYLNDDISQMVDAIANYENHYCRSAIELQAMKYKWEKRFHEAYQQMKKFYALYKKTLYKNRYIIIKFTFNDKDVNWTNIKEPKEFTNE